MKRTLLTLSFVVFIFFFGMTQDLPSYIPSDGLVAYYPFNGNANDESGNGHHATVNGAILSSDRDGNNEKAYEFSHEGASFGDNLQSIYIPFHSDFQSENFTVSIWFKADSYGWNGNSKIESTLFSKRENSSQPNQATYRIQLSSNFTRSEIGGPDGDDEIPCTADSDELNLGAWYHAASSYDGTTLKQYINGAKVLEINCDLSHNATSTSGIMLGQTWQYNGYYYHLDGKLDEFMVYNRSMTEQEMENYYVSSTSDILLNGTVSAENNQIKNVDDPTHSQDAATKGYVDSNINSFSGSYNDLSDKPTSFSGDLSGNVTSNFLKLNPLTQAEIDNLNPEAGTIVFNADSQKFIGYNESAGHELDQSQENQNQLFDNPNTAQSFTAGNSGSLSKIDVKLSNGMNGQPDNNITLTLRDGEGIDGDVLFSMGLSTSSSTAEWISVDISGVEITQGNKYTIHLTSTTFIDEVFMWARDNTNPYPNGKSFYSNTSYTDYDLCFKTYLSTTGWVDLD
jgi:hypothetical protein